MVCISVYADLKYAYVKFFKIVDTEIGSTGTKTSVSGSDCMTAHALELSGFGFNSCQRPDFLSYLSFSITLDA